MESEQKVTKEEITATSAAGDSQDKSTNFVDEQMTGVESSGKLINKKIFATSDPMCLVFI